MLAPMGTEIKDVQTTKPTVDEVRPPRWPKWLTEPMTKYIAVGVVALVIGIGLTSLVFAPRLMSANEYADGIEQELERAETGLSAAQSGRDAAEERYEQLEEEMRGAGDELAEREAALEAAEATLAEDKAEVESRESAVFDRESAADWWILQVRECLARSGADRVATVTEGNLIGRDITCYTT